ncbi:hypothetical protein DUI87_35544 [Hirundo rustica rustica]|uniref:Uncharacterized protein n=1 Tax=Hirundo rustica rustica TaxID=333673 RepID=A0A3M0IG92_HIRRU|nr:hypothetical protein DUI87_35544 [Hirundo rustica rustica]
MTEAAIRTKERGWIHASRIKGPVEEPKEWSITSEPGDTKLTLKRGLGAHHQCGTRHAISEHGPKVAYNNTTTKDDGVKETK